MSPIETFDLGGPLPERRLAIEASAGTGKTFTLATMATRYVAEADVAIGELLIVTFTRAAAAELKDRVRARLVELAGLLEWGGTTDDPVLSQLLEVDDGERARRLVRLRTAIADFDAATITTIHGFAQQVLGSLGSTVPTDPDAVLVDDTAALVRQVATDLLAREAVQGEHDAADLPGHGALVKAAQLALGNPAARLVPDPDDAELPAAAVLRRRLVDELMAEVTIRRQAAGSLSFDDLLVRLRDALTDPVAGPAARQALRRRFRVALIDEFQDTDPVQWAIFDTLFGRADEPGERPTSLTLVGDPKQAIYAFRGADVHTYLQAAHAEGTDLRNLGVNWRSDGDVLVALEQLFTGATFGAADIAFQPVDAPDHHRERRLVSTTGDRVPALSIRLAHGPGMERQKKKSEYVTSDPARAVIYADLAQHVRSLLETALVPDDRHPAGRRELRPDDVAVLISGNWEAPLVRDALLDAGIPAVITRGDNVLESEAAAQWHRVLHALARPADPRRARAFALSWFVGWDAEQLAAADDLAISTLQEQLHRWGEVLSRQGVAAFVGTVRAETGVAARVLARTDGDRTMTDLEHVAELLQLASPRTTSPMMLLATFEQMAGGDEQGDPEADLAARRCESEALAVQIMTTYVSKGLEFPVVCCPSLWAITPVKREKVDLKWWDAAERARTVDVASDVAWPDAEGQQARRDLAVDEAVGSNLRVLYVALTRARHHTAVWWAPVEHAEETGLARVLFARDADGRIDPAAYTARAVEVPFDGGAVKALAPLVTRGAGRIEVEEVDAPTGPTRQWAGGRPPSPADLTVASLDHTLDRDRRRWSFTLVTSRAHGSHDHVVDPLDDSVGDAGDADEQLAPDTTGAAAASGPPGGHGAVDDDGDHGDGGGRDEGTDGGSGGLPLGTIAGGAGFGTLVHEVLERVDFTAPDLEAELAAATAERLTWSPWPVDADQLVHGLAAVVRTPLGPQFAGRALAELPPTDRLNELDFDLTLAEGGTRATDADVGRLLLTHLPPGDPLRPWAERLAEGPFAAVLAGHLTGSIDLVARVRHDDGRDRFVVVDYKTNRLAPPGVAPTSAMFRPDRLVAAMAGADYPLQALLYSVALHRYLRWRLRGYDPAVHLGGIGYLFVRGMVGPATPTVDGVPHGLFSWQPPVALVTGLSDLLDGAGLPTGVGR